MLSAWIPIACSISDHQRVVSHSKPYCYMLVTVTCWSLSHGGCERHAGMMQVRSAATMGGNLALTKQQGLESDAATLLAALAARVAVVSIDNAETR